jgi:hypothetical protein
MFHCRHGDIITFGVNSTDSEFVSFRNSSINQQIDTPQDKQAIAKGTTKRRAGNMSKGGKWKAMGDYWLGHTLGEGVIGKVGILRSFSRLKSSLSWNLKLISSKKLSVTKKAIQHDLELINFRYGRKQASRVND